MRWSLYIINYLFPKITLFLPCFKKDRYGAIVLVSFSPKRVTTKQSSVSRVQRSYGSGLFLNKILGLLKSLCIWQILS